MQHFKKRSIMTDRILKGKELDKLWDEICEEMGEMAALGVACEMLGINKNLKWDYLSAYYRTQYLKKEINQ